MITVLGGSGFIGTRLCQRLSDRQIPFEIVDLTPSQSFPEKTKIADIRDYPALSAAVTGTKIINLAAVHRDDVRDRSEYFTTNVDGVRNVVRLAEARNIETLVFTSTVAVYGFAEPGTDESGKINPFNAYGASKFEGEEALRAWHSQDPDTRNLTILRPTVVFGEGNRGNVFNLLNQVASGRFVMIGRGRNRKSMAYVGNVAAFLHAATETVRGYQLFNYVDTPDFDMNALITTLRNQLGKGRSVGPRLPYWLGLIFGRLADLISWITGRNLPLSTIRVQKFCANTCFASGAARLAGFTPPYSLVEGLERTIASEFIAPDPNRQIFFTE